LATSNRIVVSKSAYFEPSNWLGAAQSILADPVGAPCRPTSRTSLEIQLRHLDDLWGVIGPLDGRDQLARLMGIFDKHIGKGKKAERKDSKNKPGVPQWKYNLKGQRPKQI
jgi:hypothetical protein